MQVTVRQLSSTTTSLGKVRGFSVHILNLLNRSMLLASEIAEILDKENRYVWAYLTRLKSYGLIERRGQFWYLTDLGEAFIERIKRIEELKEKKNLINFSRTPTEKQQKENRKPTEHLHKTNISELDRNERSIINLRLEDLGSYNLAEKVVVEYLFVKPLLQNRIKIRVCRRRLHVS
ncbi:hypothetical protein CW702_02935 [Candidatus Bathyarchaeota archaeon]|nr:MAG: hypothetical protein CW702_02935 [Candidatus Bathyarchaeota archaeon]